MESATAAAGVCSGGGSEGPSSSSGSGDNTLDPFLPPPTQQLSRYESQKRRDWNTFLQYLKSHKPPLSLSRCSGAHVIEFLKYLDQFGKTKVHISGCTYFGLPKPPSSCTCPLKQAWGSLDALIGRLRAAYEESGGRPESNPFAAKAVRSYLREVRDSQAKARGIPYEKKKRKRATTTTTTTTPSVDGSGGAECSTTSKLAVELSNVSDGGGGAGGSETVATDGLSAPAGGSTPAPAKS